MQNAYLTNAGKHDYLEGESNTMSAIHAAIIEARFYSEISDALYEGAVHSLHIADATHERFQVPGVLEIPAALAMIQKARGKEFQVYVLLGCVIRGETSHYDIVANESARAIMNFQMRKRLCVGNGIITVENEAQAWARARLSEKNKGGGAADAAIALMNLNTRLYGPSDKE